MTFGCGRGLPYCNKHVIPFFCEFHNGNLYLFNRLNIVLASYDDDPVCAKILAAKAIEDPDDYD